MAFLALICWEKLTGKSYGENEDTEAKPKILKGNTLAYKSIYFPVPFQQKLFLLARLDTWGKLMYYFSDKEN